MEKKFTSQVLEYLGYLSAFAVAISQYFFKDNFKVFFEQDLKLYSASSLFVLLASIVIIIAIFSNRNLLNNKFYFSRKSKDDFNRKLREEFNSNKGQFQNYINEPRYFTLKGLALVLILISLVMFYFFISTQYIIWRSVVYILLVLCIVSAVTIYATILYLENDFKQREKDKKEQIQVKIQEHFAGDIKTCSSWVDTSNILFQFRKLIIEREGKKYLITANANDPEAFFNVEELKSGV